MKLYVQISDSSYQEATKDQILAAAYAITSRSARRGAILSQPKAVKDFLLVRFSALEHEVFVVIFLDNRNRVIKVEEMFRGTIDGASVHTREVVKAALLNNAAAVIFAHNHPSGVPEPSQADEFITRRLKEALSLIDVRILDHFIVGEEFVTSFAERGLL